MLLVTADDFIRIQDLWSMLRSQMVLKFAISLFIYPDYSGVVLRPKKNLLTPIFTKQLPLSLHRTNP